jgi:hypothetical protein
MNTPGCRSHGTGSRVDTIDVVMDGKIAWEVS